MPYHSRASPRLLSGRQSLSSSCYFLTWCTHQRARILVDPVLLESIRTAIRTIDQSDDGTVLAATVMPDHVHLLLNLGSRLTLGQVVAKTKAAVTRKHPSVQWQLNFFEHRLRLHSDAESFALYIFMNPYCAELCSLDENWPGWVPSRTVRWSFEGKLRNGCLPQEEWLPEAARFGRNLPAGAD